MLKGEVEVCSECERHGIIHDQKNMRCLECYHKFIPVHLKKESDNEDHGNNSDLGS